MEAAPAFTIRDEVITFLISAPPRAQIIDSHASEAAQVRLSCLLDKQQDSSLSPAEVFELEEASQVNHLVILMKARAQQMNG